MKKIKLLAPLFGVATVAATTVPMVSCGQSLGKVIEMKLQEDTSTYFMFESEKVQIKKDTVYTAVANLSKVTKTKKASLLGLFSNIGELEKDLDIKFKKVVLNKQVLQEIKKEEEVMTRSGWYYDGEMFVIMSKIGTEFDLTGKAEISFTVNQDLNDVILSFGNES